MIYITFIIFIILFSRKEGENILSHGISHFLKENITTILLKKISNYILNNFFKKYLKIKFLYFYFHVPYIQESFMKI